MERDARLRRRGLQTRLIAFSSRIQRLDGDGAKRTATTIVEGTARIIDESGQFGAKRQLHIVPNKIVIIDRRSLP